MASFHVDFPDDLVRQIERLANSDEIQERMLKEASPIMEESLKTELEKHKDSGKLVTSIKTKIKKNHIGWFAVSRPMGRDSKGVRNMAKLMYIEWGTRKQPARPLVSRAVKNVESKVIAKMQEVFDDYIDK